MLLYSSFEPRRPHCINLPAAILQCRSRSWQQRCQNLNPRISDRNLLPLRGGVFGHPGTEHTWKRKGHGNSPDCRNRRIWARRPLEVIGCFHQGADSSLPLPILCRRRPQTVHDPRACKSSQTTQRQHHSKTTYNNRLKTAPKKFPRPQGATPRPIETTLRTAPEDRIEHAHTFQDHSEITTSVGPATSAARGRGL